MLSFENSNVYAYGPQHSTPVKGQETLLCQTQKTQNSALDFGQGRVSANAVPAKKCFTIDDFKLLQNVDLESLDTPYMTDCTDSIIDISKISVIENTPNVFSAHNNSADIKTHLDSADITSLNNSADITSCNNSADIIAHNNSAAITEHCLDTLCESYPQINQNNNSPGNRTPTLLKYETSEQEHLLDKHGYSSSGHYHDGFIYSRAMPSECLSDSDLSKQSLSPRAIYQHVESSEMSYGKVMVSPSKQRLVKSFHKVRSSSVPRFLLTDANICNRQMYDMPNFGLPEGNKTSTAYIEQDIINKQRQEIQLLMEELSSRDQELNDLVMSHQKQVKVWESNNEKLAALQTRLSQYEEELKNREKQLKDSLAEMAQVNEQREVDGLELKQTQNEMMKLAERIMENSLYIKEMEAQNQKLTASLRDFVCSRQSFSAREKELRAEIDEKEIYLKDKQKEIDKLADHIKYLEGQCDELGERNNNTAVESINWKKKYIQVKEEAEKWSAECKAKEENVQKMTQQLHESLQQAIALQKALFTSCEREKCKEEVMYSLRKQHKRTMQELQNIRELYDRLTRDTTLYHLSVKDKESSRDRKKKDEDTGEGRSRKSKGDCHSRFEEGFDRRRSDSKRKHDSTVCKLKPGSDQSFLVKETKERKHNKDEKSGYKNVLKVNDRGAGKSGEKGDERNKSYIAKSSDPGVCVSEFECAFQKTGQKLAPKGMKAEQQTAGSGKMVHTTMCHNIATITSSTTLINEDVKRTQNGKPIPLKNKNPCTENTCAQVCSLELRNISKNADFKDSRSRSSSRISTENHTQPQKKHFSVMINAQERYVKSVTGVVRNEDAGGDLSSEASHLASPSQFDGELTPADSDGMCHELKRDISRVESEHFDSMSPLPENSALESRRCRTPSNSLPVTTRNSFLRKDKVEKKPQSNGPTPVLRKKVVEFEANEDMTQSLSMETHSQYLGPESETYSHPPTERWHSSMTQGVPYSQTNLGIASNYQNKPTLSVMEVAGMRHVNEAQTPMNISHPTNAVPNKVKGGNQQHGNECEQEQKISGRDCQRNSTGYNNHVRIPEQKQADVVQQWRAKSCSYCRGQGKSVCDCLNDSRSHPAFASKTNNHFEPDTSKSDARYAAQCGLAVASSFNEIVSPVKYESSMSKSLINHQLKSTERGRSNVNSASEKINSSSYQHSNPKVHFLSPKGDEVYDQREKSAMGKTAVPDLPERISTYLAKHLSTRKEVCNHNNSRHFDQQLNLDLSEIPENGNDNFTNDQLSPTNEGKWSRNLDYGFPNSSGVCLQEHDFQLTNAEDVVELRAVRDSKSGEKKESQKEEMKETNCDNATNNNSKRTKRSSGHSILSHMDPNDNFRVNNCQLFGHEIRSSELNDKDFTEQWRLKNMKQMNQHGHVSAKNDDPVIINKTRSYVYPQESDTESTVERHCHSEHLSTKREKDAERLSVYVPASSISSVSARGPSLYRHLSQIHFSEKTRRYEWTTPPVLDYQDKEVEAVLLDEVSEHVSNRKDRSNMKFVDTNLAANHGYREILMPNKREKKLKNQLADSGHFSNSGGQSELHVPREKQLSQKNKRTTNVSPSKRQGRSEKCHTDSEISGNEVFEIAYKDSRSGRDTYNTNCNNSCGDDSCLGSCHSASTDLHTIPFQNFDPVVKKLEFTDSALEESRSETGDFEISDRSVEIFVGDSQKMILVKNDLGIPPNASPEIDSKTVEAFDIRRAQGTERYDCNIRFSHNNQKGCIEERYLNMSHSSICEDPGCTCVGYSITLDSPRCINLSQVGTNDKLRCSTEEQDLVSDRQRCCTQGHYITNDCHICTNQMLSSLHESPGCTNQMLPPLSDSPGCTNLLFSSFTESQVHTNEMFPPFSESTGCTNQMHSAISENPVCTNPVNFLRTQKEHLNKEINFDSEGNQWDERTKTNTKAIRGKEIASSSEFFEFEEIGHSNQKPTSSEHILVQNRKSDNKNMMESLELATSLSVSETKKEAPSFDNGSCRLQNYNISTDKQPENCFENTRDSTTSIVRKSSNTWPVPAWLDEESLLDTAEKFDDTLSAFLDDPKHDNKSFMSTSISPLSKLYKLLLKSQEMVHSLEKSSVISKPVQPKDGDHIRRETDDEPKKHGAEQLKEN